MKQLVTVVACLMLITKGYAQPKIGEKSPGLQLRSTTGSTINLADLNGKYVLVDFWASWCAPCRVSNRQLAPLYARYQQKGFEIVGVSLDESDPAWKKAIATDKIRWIQVREEGGWEAPHALKWGIEQLPTSFLLDKSGTIISIDPSAGELEAVLRQGLK